jgi:hypothetical protein
MSSSAVSMVARRYPDDREEHGLQLTFEEFVTTARHLYVEMQDENLTEEQEDRASKKFFRFVLAGRTQVDDITRHITLNACQGLQEPEAYEVTRDYDSLIGVSTDLPYRSHLALNPVPPFKETLFKPNHMKSIVYRDVSNITPKATAVRRSLNMTSSLHLGCYSVRSHAQDSQLRLRQGRNTFSDPCILSTHVLHE